MSNTESNKIEYQGQKTSQPAGKIRSSITNKLTGKLFLRLVGLFLSFNILICVIAGVSLLIYIDRTIIRAIDMIPELQPAQSADWAALTGADIRIVSEATISGSRNDGYISRLSFDPDYVYRGFQAYRDGFNNTLRSIEFIVNVGYNGLIYEVKIQIGLFILYFVYAMIVLIVIELLTLGSQVVEDRRMIRKTLHPITDLAQMAQNLNEANRQIDREKVLSLPGFLDGIDAGRLDLRITVDDLQDELKSVAIAINGMLDRINESYAAQARFVSDASHELRTPIAVIQGYANLLDRWGMEDEKTLKESVSAIKDEADNMNELVEQLLFLARGDSNRINMIIEQVEVSELINEVITESRIIDDSHEFKVTCESMTVPADRGLLKQALRILVDNAIKYTDKGREITVSANVDGSFARLSVSDEGIGIKPEVLPYVFDRFVRADDSRARATGGAGLGLSIADWIATRHSGYLEVLSREGIGTKITVILPGLADKSDYSPTNKTESLPELI
ncbi:MAG: HAMP domain-containing histidine kinase [Oscillospiraceae bacterium]|nr:HAMP domain-containing histidine kinase [Oscillospiraceae bacterium]